MHDQKLLNTYHDTILNAYILVSVARICQQNYFFINKLILSFHWTSVEMWIYLVVSCKFICKQDRTYTLRRVVTSIDKSCVYFSVDVHSSCRVSDDVIRGRGSARRGRRRWSVNKGQRAPERWRTFIPKRPDILNSGMKVKKFIIRNKLFEINHLRKKNNTGSEQVKLISNVTACCKMYVLSGNCYKKGTKTFCMFESTLYLLVRQKKCLRTNGWNLMFRRLNSDKKMFSNIMSFEMTKAVAMYTRVVFTNYIYSLKYNCLIIQNKTSLMCVCVGKRMFIVRHNCEKKQYNRLGD